MKKYSNIVVTGGAGFIGGHLVERLIKEGNRVTVIDNFATGRPENLAAIKDNKSLSVFNADVADFPKIKAYFEGVDCVFHLAALADIVPSIWRPLDYHRANVDGTIAVLEAARLAGVSKFVYTASSSCYGIPDEIPTAESAIIMPMYPYAVTKYLGEQYALNWNKIYKLPVTSLRLFNVYGPRARTTGTYGAVFGVFLAQKLAGKPFTVVGDGLQTRDFTFVSDIVSAFIAAAESDISGEIFNVGSGGTYSINTLVELLKGEVTHIKKRPGEPDCTFANIDKILKNLDWKPNVKFTDGVKIMLDNIEHWKTAPIWDEKSISKETADWFKYLGK
ncbi:MAG: SDR family oxidoreductase [Elusimicrobia bacterium]|nr:SDR family oxidoreductase [Elusimicrobiota bacterium]